MCIRDRLVFLIIEGIRRKPVPPKYEGYVHAAGLMLLLMLMVYAVSYTHLSRKAGHKVGAETFRTIATYCKDIGVQYFTVYAFLSLIHI